MYLPFARSTKQVSTTGEARIYSGVPMIVPIHISPYCTLPPWKRVIDVSCCIIALPFLAVTALGLALVMKVTAPGPLVFRQERVGHRGRRFCLYKFRTMRVGAGIALHQAHFSHCMISNIPMQKLDAADNRLIPGGWLVRACGLDELPQIINVLRGEMSIVGPRPCIPYEYEEYTPAQRNRLSSVPGLTGLWQVSGKNRTTFDEMVKLDIDYARRSSFTLDLQIIVRTIPALLMQISDMRSARGGAKSPDKASLPAAGIPVEAPPMGSFANTISQRSFS